MLSAMLLAAVARGNVKFWQDQIISVGTLLSQTDRAGQGLDLGSLYTTDPVAGGVGGGGGVQGSRRSS